MKKAQIESILFFSGEPVDLRDLKENLAISESQLNDIMEELQKKYNKCSGIVLDVFDNKAVLQTNESNYDTIIGYLEIDKEKRLTSAAIEVLSIVAYKQPVTKSKIDYIRGVKSDNILRRLIEEEFIYVSGSEDGPGKPNLYSTTNTFLRRFNIKNLSELPDLEVKLK